MKRPILSVAEQRLNLGMTLVAGAAAQDRRVVRRRRARVRRACLMFFKPRPVRRRRSPRMPTSRATVSNGDRRTEIFRAVPVVGGRELPFFGAAGVPPCGPGKSCEGTFAFSGTLDHVTGAENPQTSTCSRLGPRRLDFRPGLCRRRPRRVRFDDRAGHAGWLMSFHGEYHWKNQANPPGYWCFVGKTKSQVACPIPASDGRIDRSRADVGESVETGQYSPSGPCRASSEAEPTWRSATAR